MSVMVVVIGNEIGGGILANGKELMVPLWIMGDDKGSGGRIVVRGRDRQGRE